jgi:hypothetical protein
VLKNGKVVINSPENIYALRFMRDLITKRLRKNNLVN